MFSQFVKKYLEALDEIPFKLKKLKFFLKSNSSGQFFEIRILLVKWLKLMETISNIYKPLAVEALHIYQQS